MKTGILFILPVILLGFSVPSLPAQEELDGLKEYRLGNFEAAVEICRTELQASPHNMDSYAVLCWSLVRLQRFDEAARHAVAARAINHYDPRIVEILAEARFHQGMNEEALKLFQEYLTLAPEGGRVDAAYYYMANSTYGSAVSVMRT